MLKIVLVQNAPAGHTLRLEGSVIGPWVAELRRSCEAVLDAETRLTLDLSDVWFIDQEGIRLCKALMDRRVVLANCPAFVAGQLEMER